MTSEEQQQEFLHSLRIIGIVLIVLSGITIILAIVACVVSHHDWSPFTHIGAGIWGSLFICAVGILTLVNASSISICAMPWVFGSSIFSSCMALTIVTLEVCAGIHHSRYEVGQSILHLFIFMVAMPQFVLCLYLSVIFGRMVCSGKYRISVEENCPSICCFTQGNKYPAIYYGALNTREVIQA